MTYNRISSVKNHFLPIFLFFCLALAACEDESGCVSDDSDRAIVTFYQIDDTVQRNLDNDIRVGIIPVGGNPDSTNINDGLPLNPSADGVTYYLFYDDGSLDTVVLSYQREQTLISPECGPSQRYFNLAVDTSLTTLDSIRVVDQEVSSLNSPTSPNIEIYTCPDTFYTDNIRINFLEKEADTTLIRADSLFVQSIRDDRGQVLAEPNDTIVGSLRVPVNPQANSVTLTFELLPHDGDPARTETLTLSYEAETLRLARQCRQETRYFDLDTVGYTFDSLSIEDSELAIDVPLNIEVIDILE